MEPLLCHLTQDLWALPPVAAAPTAASYLETVTASWEASLSPLKPREKKLIQTSHHPAARTIVI
jgi:hypothetical protein